VLRIKTCVEIKTKIEEKLDDLTRRYRKTDEFEGKVSKREGKNGEE